MHSGAMTPDIKLIPPQVRSINHQTFDALNEVKTHTRKALQGTSKVVVNSYSSQRLRRSVGHDHITRTMTMMLHPSDVFNHQLDTFKQTKIALTSLLTNMRLCDNQ